MEFVPVYVICHNNGWLVQDTIAALRPYTEQFVILDNASRDRATRSYLHGLQGDLHVSVIHMSHNRGPRCFYAPDLWDKLPDWFAVTDPDLAYPSTLPPDFMLQLKNIATIGLAFKAGLALDISGPPEIFQIAELIEPEKRHWSESMRVPAPPPYPPIYMAPIDTTFAVYCKANYKSDPYGPSLRVAGPFTAQHRPWYKSFWDNDKEKLRATYDGAQWSTTGVNMANMLGIAPVKYVGAGVKAKPPQDKKA